MSREAHVRFWESGGVELPPATQLPLNRQVKIFQREGITLSPNSLMEWVATIAEALSPLASMIHKRVVRSWIIQSDDTGLMVLDADKAGGSRKGRIWANVGDGRFGRCQDSCRVISQGRVAILLPGSGLRQTVGIGSHRRILRDHRSGCLRRAAA